MKFSAPVSAAVLGLLATFSPTSSLAALTSGVGTFTSSSSGRWLYYDLNTKQIFFGSTSTSSPPATVFNITAAIKFKWSPKPYTTIAGRGVTYRTFSTGSTASSLKYNVSTFYPPKQASSTSPFSSNSYAYTVKWIGDAFQPGRPMLMYLGGSDARTNQIREETDVLAKTQSTGFPKVLAANSTLGQALLKNYLVVVPASPTCYNTTTNSYSSNSCGVPNSNHFIKHYRPWELKRIYDEVLNRFSFDTTRFALVGTGMGGRGGLRFLLDYPTLPAAVSMVSGALETSTSLYIKALPYTNWNSGEGCWDVTKPNVGGTCASENVVQPTMEKGAMLTGFPIRLWSSRYDDVDTLAEATETCKMVNSGSKGNCTVIDTKAPNHPAMAYYSRDVSDVEWLASYQRLPGQASRLIGSTEPVSVSSLVTETSTISTSTTASETITDTVLLPTTTASDPGTTTTDPLITPTTATDSDTGITATATVTDPTITTDVTTETPTDTSIASR
ncbi:hypothetical protein A4X09_0g5867 [Tilletia walkeri]|uniref:Feruloyl esterase n=1 Tax=Tilletia walkeri TaxID=117179 RepID=A0A8X7N670_9BASI|nr:hypothetical protein A4X09_0g5867 [Tilletia walkeri]